MFPQSQIIAGHSMSRHWAGTSVGWVWQPRRPNPEGHVPEESHPNPMCMNGRSLHPKLLLPTTTPSKWQSHGPEGTRPHQINNIRQPWWSTRRYGQVRQRGSHSNRMSHAIPMKDTRSELRHEQVQGQKYRRAERIALASVATQACKCAKMQAYERASMQTCKRGGLQAASCKHASVQACKCKRESVQAPKQQLNKRTNKHTTQASKQTTEQQIFDQTHVLYTVYEKGLVCTQTCRHKQTNRQNNKLTE